MKHRNNTRILIFGRPGSGKTTLSVKFMKEALWRGEYVFSNIKIKWMGDLYYINIFHKIINKIFSFILTILLPFINKKRKKYEKKLEKWEFREQGNTFIDNIPTENLTFIYVQKYLLIKAIEGIKKLNVIRQEGYFKNHYYEPERYIFTEDLQEAQVSIIRHATEYPETYHGLYWDEGFIDLDFSQGVNSDITNFFNQSRKLNVDVIVSSQRPVAVYPAFRALCEYMILVKKLPLLNWFMGYKFFVDDDPNALPDLSKDIDGHNQGKLKWIWRGKYIWPYFATKESIGLIKLITRKLKV